MHPVELNEPMIALIIYLLENAPSVSGSWDRYKENMAVAFLPEEILDRKEELTGKLLYLQKTLKDAEEAGVFTLRKGTRYTLLVNLGHPSVVEVSARMKNRRINSGNLATEIRERLGKVLPPPSEAKQKPNGNLSAREAIVFFLHCNGGSLEGVDTTFDLAVFLNSRHYNADRTKVGEHLRNMVRGGQIERSMEGNRITGVSLVYGNPRVKKALAKAGI